MKKLVTAMALGLVLAGCGGNDNSSEGKAAAFSGLYSDIDGEAFTLILNSGQYYLFTGDLVFGRGTLAPGRDNSFASSDFRVFSMGSVPDGQDTTVTGTYTTGTIAEGGARATVEVEDIDGDSNEYEFTSLYADMPTTESLDREPSGELRTTASATVVNVQLNISATGDITSVAAPVVADPVVTDPVIAEPDTAAPAAVEAAEAKAVSDCTLSGKLNPVKGGYSLQVSFGAAPCPMAGQTVEGVAFRPQSDSNLLVGLLVNAAQTEAVRFLIGRGRKR
ncbi:hypothetical protein [Solimonas sp. SE-A11]|uniref:hypothetical protein n=1 Tax=Solimonas sp. SE-A11 TaxID=3054954 RepID=UPI00259CD71C|nr:hypothetical protein [Solimonas sp. SE-A11]MDM4768701.1 hypothetical protein [Solimonas sp. SE-A11]